MAPPSTAGTDGPTDQVEHLVAVGRPHEAIAQLTARNHHARASSVEAALVDLRHRSFPQVPRVPVERLPAPVRAEAPSGSLVELDPADLDVDGLRRGLATQGCVLIRGLVGHDRAAELRAGIDAALDAFDAADPSGAGASDEAAQDGWYRQFVPEPGAYRVGGRRQWVRKSGALWTADSPRMLFELTGLIDDTGIGDLVTEYLGERPVLSANKCTLRRVPLTARAGWHQDGAFLGESARSLNLWLALDHCGTDAPGLDLVPRRFDRVVPAGTDGAIFDWSVAPDVVTREAGDVGIVRPEFAPGDALLFDHFLLHSTAVEPTMTNERHAMETWFFGPSSYPDGQIPLVY